MARKRTHNDRGGARPGNAESAGNVESTAHRRGGSPARILSGSEARGHNILALTIALFALALRVVYLLESHDNPFRDHLGLDPRQYDLWARAILHGQVFGPGPFPQAPLYPYFLAAVYAVLGADPGRPLWIQALLGAATAYFGALIAARWWGRRASLITGILLALYKPAIFYSGVLLVPTLATFLLALGILLAARHPIAAGVCGGMTALAHPVALPAAAGAAGFVNRDPARVWHADRRVRIFSAAFVSVILLATFHNLVAGSRIIPIAVNTGINLYIGNGPHAEGYYAQPPGQRADEDLLGISEAQRLSGRRLSATQASAYWTGQTVRAIREHPLRAIARFLAKTYFFFHAYEAPQVESLDFEKRYSTLLKVPLLPNWIALVALAAFAIVARPSDRRLRLLAIAAVASALFVAVFFVTGRFRYPAHLLLALMAGAGFAGVWPSWRRIGVAVAAAAAAILLFAPNWLGIARERTFAQYNYRLGVIAEQESHLGQARDFYAAALRLDPNQAAASINLGILTARAGDLDAAEPLLARGIELNPRSARAHLAWGQIAQVRGDLATARDRYARAWEADTTFLKGLEALATTYYILGETDAASRECARLLEHARGDPVATRCRFILDRMAFRRGHGLSTWQSTLRADADLALSVRDLARAAKLYREALAFDARDAVALYELISIEHSEGDFANASRHAQDYLAAGGPPALLQPFGLAR